MSVDIDDQVARLLAERHFSKEPVNDWAIRCLEAGYDSRSLRMLAGMLPAHGPSEFDEKLRAALKELGWASVLPGVYLMRYARIIAREIVEDKLDAIEGSYEMYKVLRVTDSPSEMDFWYTFDEILCDQRNFVKTGRKGYFYRETGRLIDEIKEACYDFLGLPRPNMASLQETSFEDGEESFKKFLKDNDVSDEILWVFREDLILEGYNKIAIRIPLAADNRDRATECFELGKKRDLGVAFFAICTLDGATCCFIQLPKNESDARNKLIGNRYLKYSCQTGMPKARAIVNSVLWRIKELFVNKKKISGWDDMIPSKITLLPVSYGNSSMGR